MIFPEYWHYFYAKKSKPTQQDLVDWLLDSRSTERVFAEEIIQRFASIHDPQDLVGSNIELIQITKAKYFWKPDDNYIGRQFMNWWWIATDSRGRQFSGPLNSEFTETVEQWEARVRPSIKVEQI